MQFSWLMELESVFSLMDLDLISLEGNALPNSEFLVVCDFGMALYSLPVNVQCCVPLPCSYWLSLLASLSSVSYLHPDMRRRKWLIIQLLSYCSLAQLFCGEGGTMQILLACVRSAPSGWTTWGSQCDHARWACTSQDQATQAPICATGE